MSEFPDEIEDDLGMCGLSYEDSKKLHAKLRAQGNNAMSKLHFDTHAKAPVSNDEGFFTGYGDLMCAFLAGCVTSALLIALFGG